MSGAPGSLPPAEWPRLDREAWQTASTPGMRLRRGGAASHLKAVTRDDLANRYGLFLDFLQRTRRLKPNGAAGEQVTPPSVEAYVVELQARVSSVTVYGSIYKLRRATQLIAPDHDVSWLREIENDLGLVMKPKSKYGRLVLAEKLVAAGLTLMLEADAALHRTPLQRATQYRNGLMIALLACCPIRLKNFAALTLGKSLVRIEKDWWVALTAQDTKEGRPDERRVPEFLGPRIDDYLAFHRPTLARLERGEMLDPAVWLSSQGRPMSYLGVEDIVTKTTLTTLGVPVSPHLFRTSAATTAAHHAGTTPQLASALLDHRDPTTTRQHYNRASSLSAGKSYLALVRDYTAS